MEAPPCQRGYYSLLCVTTYTLYVQLFCTSLSSDLQLNVSVLKFMNIVCRQNTTKCVNKKFVKNCLGGLEWLLSSGYLGLRVERQ